MAAPRTDAARTSSRCHRATKPIVSYMDVALEALQNPYSEDNPDGCITMAIAENKLVLDDLIAPRLAQGLAKRAEQISERGFADQLSPFYGDMKGAPRVRAKVADFFDWALLNDEAPHGYSFNPNNVIIGPGCTSLLDTLAWNLADAGEGIIVPAPYYPAFDNDFCVRAELKIIPAEQEQADGSFILTEAALEAAAESAKAQGINPRILVITNPNNPLATNYSHAELLTAYRFADKHGLHLISDEIYARSVHAESGEPFVSMAQISLEEGLQDGGLGPRLHLLYGLSKDFTCSGFRVGVIYSENAELQAACANLQALAGVGTPTQDAIEDLLGDLEWAKDFLHTSAQRLAANAAALADGLESLGCHVLRPSAGLFLVADLNPLAPGGNIETFEDELRFFHKIYDETKIVASPGEACHFRSPGWFRFCFAAVSLEAVKVAVERLRDFSSAAE